MPIPPARRPVIAPSILAADFARLGEEVAGIEAAGGDWLHLDVMDGHFVPNISFGPGLIAALRLRCTLPMDVHLMIAPVDPYLHAFAEAGADIITFHPEAGPHPYRTAQHIRSLGRKVGIALNPGTPLEAVVPLLPVIDLVLVMTVNPGFGGQAFLDTQLPRIAALRKMIDATGRDIVLEVDGGINATTAPLVLQAGAEALVAGTAVFGQADRAGAIATLRLTGGATP